MSIAFHVIIPARLESTRLPNKLVQDLNGMSVLERSWRQAIRSGAKSVLIACDDPLLFRLAKTFGADCCMTGIHQSGTDRIAEAVRLGHFAADDIIVNLQGDEPFIDPRLIRQVAESLAHSQQPMATLCYPVQDQEELYNPSVVKVVRNHVNEALYFSRSPIPMHRESSEKLTGCYRHIGIYAYRVTFLNEFISMPVASIEQYECLEQLRVLYHGYRMMVADAHVKPAQDINTAEDLNRARQILSACAFEDDVVV